MPKTTRKAVFIMPIWLYGRCLKCWGGFRGEVSRTVSPFLLEKIPNFADAATEAVIQPRNTRWGKSLISNGNKIAFWPEVSMSLQLVVDGLVPLYVREQTALQRPLKSLSCRVRAEEPFGVWQPPAGIPAAACRAEQLRHAEGALAPAVRPGWKPPRAATKRWADEKAARSTPWVRFLPSFPSF